MRNVCNILVGNHEGKRPFGRHRRRMKDNIKSNLRGIGYVGAGWIHVVQDRDQRGLL
jgi:hypothetical protein